MPKEKKRKPQKKNFVSQSGILGKYMSSGCRYDQKQPKGGQPLMRRGSWVPKIKVWFEEHEFKVLTWPPKSPHLRPLDQRGVLLTSWCQIQHQTFTKNNPTGTTGVETLFSHTFISTILL